MTPPNSQIKLLRFILKRSNNNQMWVLQASIAKVKGYTYDDLFDLYSNDFITSASPKGIDKTFYKILPKGISAIENANQGRNNLIVSIIAAVASVASLVLMFIFK